MAYNGPSPKTRAKMAKIKFPIHELPSFGEIPCAHCEHMGRLVNIPPGVSMYVDGWAIVCHREIGPWYYRGSKTERHFTHLSDLEAEITQAVLEKKRQA